MATWVLGILFFALVGGDHKKGGVAAGRAGPAESACGFPAIYNFGDDNSDTGERALSFADVGFPNGQTFFGKPSGRYCDGRLIIDFIAEHLGFPFLSAYFDPFGSGFRHGANFAAGGSAYLDNGYSPFSLEHQVFQFTQFKSRTTALYNQLSGKSKNSPLQSILPRPEDFSKALYIIDMGQNDFAFDLPTTTENPTAAIPAILDKLFQLVAILHDWEGARFFWIHNIGPVGCLPYVVKSYQRKKVSYALDQNGCVKDQNEVAQEFNRQLMEKVSHATALFPDATFTYVDVYSAKHSLIINAMNLGFDDPIQFCCGSYADKYVSCGQKGPNGTVIGTACNDPSKYISWDGIHFTEAANKLVAEFILNGSMSEPPVSLAEACSKP